jgi:cellulose biosynthesis protein BcsQ
MDSKKGSIAQVPEEGSDLTQQNILDENREGTSPIQLLRQIKQTHADQQEKVNSSDNSEQSAADSSAKTTDNTPKDKPKPKLEYIIVTSVKGGCGKSSVSLRTAIELLEKDPNRNVIIIDMDILGTCLERFVDGKIKDDGSLQSENDIAKVDPGLLNGSTYLVCQSEKHKDKQKRYFTDLVIQDYAKLKNTVVWRDYAVKRKGTANDIVSENLHIVFSSPVQAVKNMFQPKNASGYRSVVSIRYYKEVLRSFVQKLNDNSPKKFTHVIFDMPPNSDPYSECIYDILQKDEKVKKGEAGLELRVVSTYDVAHIQANLTWVEDYVHTTSYNNAFPTTIQFVFNQVFDVRGEIVKEDQEKIENAPIAPLTARIKKVFPGGVAYNSESEKTIHIVSEKVIQYKFDPKLALSSTLDTPFVITEGDAYRKEDGYDWKTGEKKEAKDK